jgi:cytochrome c-type biogenesis protein CcmE
MDARRAKFLLLGSGIVLTMGFLLVTAMSGSDGLVYYLTVSEFLEHDDSASGFRVNGQVQAGTIERLPSGEDVRFVMSDGRSALPVSYHGIIPDTFVDDADVVVEGRLRPDGVFEAHTLLAKCPSKYESADEPQAAPARDVS